MEQDEIIKNILIKSEDEKIFSKEESKLLKTVFEHPAFRMYIASKLQTNFWDDEIIKKQISLFVEDEKSNNKEFEYANLYLKTQIDHYKNQQYFYEQLTTTDKKRVDEKTKKKIEKNEFQIPYKTRK